MKTIYTHLILSTLLASGCASMRDSLILGGAVGTAAGAGVGNLASEHTTKGTIIGAVVGAGLGTAFGYLGHKGRKDKERLAQPLATGLETKKTPKLTTPRYRSVWVPDKIEGEQYIEGHRIFIIDDPGKWTTE